MVSTRPTMRQLELDFSDEAEPGQAPPEPQRGQSPSAIMAADTLGIDSVDLMERVVAPDNIDRAWRSVKANRGAPGPDGITLAAFPETFRELWPEVRQQLLEGTYHPGAARRKSIPKPDGGQRDLGIPNVIERLIQQAVMQVLTPIFDPHFSESSFGFRPGRSAHGAIKQIQVTMRAGYRWCVDMDLSKFFDRVQHDVLLARVSRRVRDKRLLKLIGRYLRAGVMVDGVVQASHEGTMQGGPLSPLLANILLDDFDKELEKRGLRFVRYADDFLVFTKTEIAAKRAFISVGNYLTRKLKLVVNQQKSRVCRTAGVEFLGFEFHGSGGKARVSAKNLAKFKEKVRSILNRNRGMSMRRRLQELGRYLRGWIGYFVLEHRKSFAIDLDKWIRRRVRACYWKSWRLPRTRLRKLKSLGIPHAEAKAIACSRKGPWRVSMTSWVQRALSNAYLAEQGLFSLLDRWNELAPLRRTA
jgi:RNA-directed DNA polymerase